MDMKLRISINTLCLEPADFATQVDLVERLGVGGMGLGIEDIAPIGAQAARRMLRDAGLSVSLLTHRAFGFADAAETKTAQERLARSIDYAQAIGAAVIVMTTGGRGSLNWGDAAKNFAEAIAPSAAIARKAGVQLGIEPTSHLYADASIAHRLSDCVTLARLADIDPSRGG